MNTFFRLTAASALTIALPVSLSAQDKNLADLHLEVIQEPPSFTPPGSIGVVAFQLTNLGPEIAGPIPGGQSLVIIGSGEILFRDGIGPEVHYPRITGGDCFRLLWAVNSPTPEDPPAAQYSVEFDPIPPGESRTCEVEYIVNPLQRSDVIVTWDPFGPAVDDPNPDNDEVALVYRVISRAVPALTPAGGAVMIVAILAGFAVLRRQRLASSRPGRESPEMPSGGTSA